ncbi:EipB family protein [uncultured Martelella sp.]|uniref:EipB family protein n=1 Tax=uncultured Martelella sp. TaxID=392331 RepID=UPI0029C80C9F|nr:DUF1849 family protein [uncultured Martelella sp.]
MRILAATGIFWTTLAVGALAAGPSATGVSLLPHRAVYELSLDRASAQSGIEGLSGRFVYLFSGSDCAGYTTEMRMVTDVVRESGSLVTDQVSSSFEDHGALAFSNTLFSDFSLQSETVGEARRTGKGGVSVTFGGDDTQPLELQDAEFPTEYMANVILAAEDGRRTYEATSFDGSGEDAMRAVTVIGDRRKGKDGEMGWPITSAYFPIGKVSGDETPDYAISMLMSADGVGRDLLMDFGNFKIAGKLTKLEKLERAPCETASAALSVRP